MMKGRRNKTSAFENGRCLTPEHLLNDVMKTVCELNLNQVRQCMDVIIFKNMGEKNILPTYRIYNNKLGSSALGFNP